MEFQTGCSAPSQSGCREREPLGVGEFDMYGVLRRRCDGCVGKVPRGAEGRKRWRVEGMNMDGCGSGLEEYTSVSVSVCALQGQESDVRL